MVTTRRVRWAPTPPGKSHFTAAALLALAGTTLARPPIDEPVFWRWARSPSPERMLSDRRAEEYTRFTWLGRTTWAVPDAGPVAAHWSSPVSGNWSDASRWSTNPFAPNNGTPAGTLYHAYIDATGAPYTVTLNADVTLTALNLAASDATLAHAAGILEMPGTFQASAGAYVLNGGTLKGGTLAFSGATFQATSNSANRLDGMTVNGVWGVGPNGVLRSSNGLTLGTGGVLTIGGFGSGLLAFDGSQSLAGGAVQFASINPILYSRLAVEGDATLTIDPETTLRGGWATIGGSEFNPGSNTLVNKGTISADVGGRWLRILPDALVNQGVLEAKSGGVLEIQATEWANTGTISANASTLTFGGAWSSTGVINAVNSTVNLGGTFSTGAWGTFNRSGGQVDVTGTLDNSGATLALDQTTGTWRLNGGSILGGSIAQSGGAILQFSSTTANRLVGVTVPGDLDLRQSGPQPGMVSARVSIENGLTLGGVARLGTGAEIRFDGDQSIAAGTYRFEGNNARVSLIGDVAWGPGVVLTNTPPATGSHSYDFFGGSLTNEGLIKLIGPNVSMIMQPDALTNAGVIEVADGARLRVGYNLSPGATAWTNPGTLRVNNGTLTLGGVLDVTGGLGAFERTGGAVGIGGTIENTGSTLTLNSATGSWEAIGGTIRGGTINFTQGAGILFNSVPGVSSERHLNLDGVTLNGNLTLGQGSLNFEPLLGLYNGLNLNGAVTMNGAGTRIAFFGQDQTLTGGTINLEAGGNGAKVIIANSSNPVTVTLAPNTTIRGGNASIGVDSFSTVGTIVNKGRISSDIEFFELNVTPTALINQGTLEVLNAGILNIAPASWTNNGLIRVMGGTLNMGSPSNQHSFTLGAGTVFQRQGGQVNIQGHLDNTGRTLTLDASTGSWRLAGGSINGGTLNLQQGAQIIPAQGFGGFGGRLRALTINGDLNFAAGLTFADGLTLNGKATINGTVRIGEAGLSQTINAGEFWFDPQSPGSTMIIPMLATQTFAPGTLIHGGNARIGYPFGGGLPYTTAVLINQGTIAADVPGKDILLQPGKLKNQGTIEAANGGRLLVHHDTAWSNAGVIRALPGSTLELDGAVKTSELGLVSNSGGDVVFRASILNSDQHLVLNSDTGSWILAGGGSIKGGQVSQLDGSRLVIGGGAFLDGVTFNNDLWFDHWAGSAGHAVVRNGLNINGTVHLAYPAAGITFDGSQTFDNATIAFETTTGKDDTRIIGDNNTILTLGPSAVVRGGRGTIWTYAQSSVVNQGLISADVNQQTISIYTERFQNQGIVEAINGGSILYIPPGLAPQPEPPVWTNEGELSIGAGSHVLFNGGFAQTETGSLVLTLASPEQYGRFHASASVTLDGTLRVALAPGYTPETGHWFHLLNLTGPVTGVFTSLDLPILPTGFAWVTGSFYDTGWIGVIPAPGSAALVLAAAALVSAGRPRREQHA